MRHVLSKKTMPKVAEDLRQAMAADPTAWLDALPEAFDREAIRAQWWAMRDECERAASVAGDLSSAEVSTTTLADMLGFTTQYTAELVRKQVLVKTARGRFRMVESVRNYVSLLRGDRSPAARGGDYEADKARKMKADADLAEILAAKEAGRLVEARTVERTWTNAIITTKTRLLALSDRLGPQVVIADSAKAAAAVIDREIRGALEEMSSAPPEEDDAGADREIKDEPN